MKCFFLNFTEFLKKFPAPFYSQEQGKNDTLRLMDLKEKPNIVGGDNVSEKEFLKLNDVLGDGNYITTSSQKESEI